MRLISLILILIVLILIPLSFVLSMLWIAESGAQLAVVLTNNTWSQYYYYNAFNYYAPGYVWFMIACAIIVFVFVAVLFLCLRCNEIER